MPKIGSGNDFVWIGGPDEGLWSLVVVGDEAIDGSGLEIDDAFEDAALEAPRGEDGVEPTGRDGREMEAPARMTPQPFDHLGVLVSGVVVEDGVDRLTGRDLALDGVQKPDELLTPVALQNPNKDSYVGINPLAVTFHSIKAAPGVLDRSPVPARPKAETADRFKQGAAEPRELIIDARRNRREYRAGDQTVTLKPAKRQRQHAL
jgi:hypothetical protein